MFSILLYFLLIVPKPSSTLGGQVVETKMREEIEPPYMLIDLLKEIKKKASFKPSINSMIKFGLLSNTHNHNVVNGSHKGREDIPGNKFFEIGKNGHILVLKRKIDRDEVCRYFIPIEKCIVTVDIAILSPPELFSVFKVKIHIEDINDNKPFFNQTDFVAINIPEDAKVGALYPLPVAIDLDSLINGVSTYKINLEGLSQGSFPFSLTTNYRNGVLTPFLKVSKILDREIKDDYPFILKAFDAFSSAKIAVKVKVLDVNDNKPAFRQRFYNSTVSENAKVGSNVVMVKAFDKDSKSKLSYNILNQSQTQFSINQHTGQIYVSSQLDYETTKEYFLTVKVTDSEDPEEAHAQCLVHIKIDNVNDHAPVISVSTLTPTPEIMENQLPEVFVAYVQVEDADPGVSDMLNCFITGVDVDKFKFKRLSVTNQFKLVSSALFDREVQNTVEVVIECEDNGYPQLKSNRTLTIKILDENDHFPVFAKNSYEIKMNENNDEKQLLTTVKATDKDEGKNGEVSYSFSAESNDTFNFFIDSSNGSIFVTTSLDREQKDYYLMKVIASDAGKVFSRSSTCLVFLTILDLNDNPPVFTTPTYTFRLYENQMPNIEIGQVKARDADLPPFNSIEYLLVNHETTFIIDKTSGLITCLQSLDREFKEQYTITAIARNQKETLVTNNSSAFLQSNATVLIIVADKNDNPPIITAPFEELNNTIYLKQDTLVGSEVFQIKANDMDKGQNSQLKYSFSEIKSTKSSLSGFFEVDSISGVVYLVSPLIDQIGRTFLVDIVVSDKGLPRLTANCRLKIIIEGKSLVKNEFMANSQTKEFKSNIELPKYTMLSMLGTVFDSPLKLLILVIATTATLLLFVLVIVIVVVCHTKKERKKRFYSRNRILPLQRPPDYTYVPRFAIKNNNGSVRAHTRTLPTRRHQKAYSDRDRSIINFFENENAKNQVIFSKNKKNEQILRKKSNNDKHKNNRVVRFEKVNGLIGEFGDQLLFDDRIKRTSLFGGNFNKNINSDFVAKNFYKKSFESHFQQEQQQLLSQPNQQPTKSRNSFLCFDAQEDTSQEDKDKLNFDDVTYYNTSHDLYPTLSDNGDKNSNTISTKEEHFQVNQNNLNNQEFNRNPNQILQNHHDIKKNLLETDIGPNEDVDYYNSTNNSNFNSDNNKQDNNTSSINYTDEDNKMGYRISDDEFINCGERDLNGKKEENNRNSRIIEKNDQFETNIQMNSPSIKISNDLNTKKNSTDLHNFKLVSKIKVNQSNLQSSVEYNKFKNNIKVKYEKMIGNPRNNHSQVSSFTVSFQILIFEL